MYRRSMARPDRWKVQLCLIMVLALAVRLTYLLAFKRGDLHGDGNYYHLGANALADGRGFIQPDLFGMTGDLAQAADHPPLWQLVLAGESLLGLRGPLAHQFVATLLGTLTVGLVALGGRELAGSRTGLVAALIAALYPPLWWYEAPLLSEVLILTTAALTVLIAYRYRRRPGPTLAAGIGVSCGLMTLTRPESILLVPLLIAPLVLLAPDVPGPRRLRMLAISCGAVVLTVAPWIGYNLTRFDHPVYLTTNLGATMLVGNCESVYYGDLVGHWNFGCLQAEGRPSDASDLDLLYRQRALDYARENLDRLPVVLVARVGRTWGIYRPTQQQELDAGNDDYGTPLAAGGLVAYYGVAVGALAGAVILRRRGVPVFPFAALVLTVTLSVLLTFGQFRYRAPAEIALVLLAGVAVDALLTRSHRQPRAGKGSPTGADKSGHGPASRWSNGLLRMPKKAKVLPRISRV